MKPVVLIFSLLILTTACTSAAPEVITEQIEVTRLVEVTKELEVTRLVEVTRIVPEIMTVVVFPTAEPPTVTTVPTPTSEPTATLPPPTIAPARKFTSAEVVAAFQSSGLEVSEVSPLVVEAGSPLPRSYVEATRFLIPSLGEGSGGRVFTFANLRERDMVYDYYQNLPLAGFSTWVSANELMVLQINSALPRERWLEYDAVFQALR